MGALLVGAMTQPLQRDRLMPATQHGCGRLRKRLDNKARLSSFPVRTFRRRRNSSPARANTSTLPAAICCHQSSTPMKIRPAFRTSSVKTPRKTPAGRPMPPRKETPPSITAVSTTSAKFTPTCGAPSANWAVCRMATSAMTTPVPGEDPDCQVSSSDTCGTDKPPFPPRAKTLRPVTETNRYSCRAPTRPTR